MWPLNKMTNYKSEKARKKKKTKEVPLSWGFPSSKLLAILSGLIHLLASLLVSSLFVNTFKLEGNKNKTTQRLKGGIISEVGTKSTVPTDQNAGSRQLPLKI